MRMGLIVAVVLAVAVVAGVGWAVYARERVTPGGPPVVAGPFMIETQVRQISTGAFPNTSGDPFATRPTTEYTVRYKDQPVAVPLADGESLDTFWEAHVLEGAPGPAVVVGQLGVWLLEEKDGALAVTALAPSTTDFSTLQWLDADRGQPGPEITIAMGDATGAPPPLSGGTKLLVDRKAVLDVPTGQVHAFVVDSQAPALQGFYPSGDPARATSPDGRQVVFAASRSVGMGYDYALVPVDWATGRAYAVPFSRTFTRFDSVWDIDRAWLAHYFDWRCEGEGCVLFVRTDVEPLPWHGRLLRSSGDMVDYRVAPVTRAMLPVLAAFIERTEGAQQVASDNPDQLLLRIGDEELTLWYQPEEAELSVFVALGDRQKQLAGWKRIERIGPAFDAELATRQHDALFGSLDGAK